MSGRAWDCIDGNEAAARVAHLLSEVIAIYPITPSSTMGELADAWSSGGRTNLWGTVPTVVEMQSEAGAAGALHGAATKGSLATTFTASQGLLLMIPNMFKLAGELTPVVIHVAARAVATHALSIFGDHSDVMAVRSTGFTMLSSGSVQEAHDLALVAHAAALESRVPVLHFFDGFRTSHEVDKIELLADEDVRALIDEHDVLAHRRRGLTPDHPTLRGSAQNPDVFFQAREACSPFYTAVPSVVQEAMDTLAARVGRQYHLVDYVGAPDAERVIVLMGSGAGAAEEAVEEHCRRGERVGLVKIRLFRPFPVDELLAAIPATATHIAVLDRTKEPGAVGEPLFQDVVTALAEHGRSARVIGGRYGLSSKEFTPAMVKAVLDELQSAQPKRRFTVGIVDDVSGTSLDVDSEYRTDPAPVRAVFYGLGSDGTVSATKEAVKIIGDRTDLRAQGYFVYDSKKSGSMTVSHLRFSPDAIRSTYLVEQAGFVGCHQFVFLDRVDVLRLAAPGATFLLNAPYPADEVWDRLPVEVQEAIVAKGLDVYVIDAYKVARDLEMPGRINWVMNACFFALSGVLPRDDAIAALKAAIAKAYAVRDAAVVERNQAAVDRALEALHRLAVPEMAGSAHHRRPAVPDHAPDFVARVTARMLAGEGDLLPVSALPVDGTFPTATSKWERRSIAETLPVWDPAICIDCGKCTIVCPHAALRMKVYEPGATDGAPDSFLSKPFRSKDLADHFLTIQVAPDDCTGCGICVDVCPVKSKTEPGHKALDMAPAIDRREPERRNWDFFKSVADLDRSLLPHDSVKGSQVLEPLFEFSGACSGCGETPYLKLLSQLFGDRTLVANATGCSSIFGGNLPTTPWACNDEGRGPAWSNSLFEDNAEFGLGMLLGLEAQRQEAARLLRELAPVVGREAVDAILGAEQEDEAAIAAQRRRVAHVKQLLLELDGAMDGRSARLLSELDALVRKSVWIVGGDGWAYDIGFGGVDHVLASGQNVNLLVLDSEVYSNTGGQASKATPRGAVAKFAAAGKPTRKKDLGALARSYGNVYVAQIAVGANDVQTVKAFLEADAWPGPSLIIAYSTCIAHGIDMATSMTHQKAAVQSGYWPLYRYHPGEDEHAHPFRLDSKKPTIPVSQFTQEEERFAGLAKTDPERAVRLAELEQADVDERWRYYEQLGELERSKPSTS